MSPNCLDSLLLIILKSNYCGLCILYKNGKLAVYGMGKDLLQTKLFSNIDTLPFYSKSLPALKIKKDYSFNEIEYVVCH